MLILYNAWMHLKNFKSRLKKVDEDSCLAFCKALFHFCCRNLRHKTTPFFIPPCFNYRITLRLHQTIQILENLKHEHIQSIGCYIQVTKSIALFFMTVLLNLLFWLDCLSEALRKVKYHQSVSIEYINKRISLSTMY